MNNLEITIVRTLQQVLDLAKLRVLTVVRVVDPMLVLASTWPLVLINDGSVALLTFSVNFAVVGCTILLTTGKAWESAWLNFRVLILFGFVTLPLLAFTWQSFHGLFNPIAACQAVQAFLMVTIVYLPKCRNGV